jgi:hypothetical protein
MSKNQKNQITDVKGNRTIPPKYALQQTLQYKTFLKRAMVESIQNAFKNHPDKKIAGSKVGIDYRTDRTDFPQVIVKFYEQTIANAGVGHSEWFPSPTDPNYKTGGPYTEFIQYGHRMYRGSLEFEIWALSTLDRDKMADAIIEVLAMSEVSTEGLAFRARIYESIEEAQPYSHWHFVALNTDLISGYGEQQGFVPWLAEDVLSFQTSYRIPVFGEFYSRTPNPPAPAGLVEEVDIYPWDEADPLDIPPESFPEGIIPEGDYLKIRKRHKVTPEPEEIHGLETSPFLETEPELETKG